MRELERRAAKSMWRPILVLVSVWLVTSVGFALDPTYLPFRAGAIGFLAASVLGIIFWLLFVSSGSYAWYLGKLGEEATAEVVCGPSRRRQGWRLVNGLGFHGLGDVDHVLIGPGGVFAIESKYTTSPCEEAQFGVDGIYGREPVSQATRAAQKIQRMLKHGPGRFDVSVTPLVVIWGRGRLKPPKGSTVINGVLVCDGTRSGDWLSLLADEQLDDQTIHAIERELLTYLDRQGVALAS